MLHKISWLSAGSIFKYIIQFGTIVLLAKKIPVNEYGNYQTVWVWVNFFSVLMLFGLNALLLSNNIFSIIHWVKDKKKLVLNIAIGLCAITFCYIFFIDKIFTLGAKIFLFIFILAQVIAIVGEALWIKQEREKSIFGITLIYFSLYFIVHLFYIYYRLDFTSLLFCLSIITIIKAVVLFVFRKKIAKYDFKDNNIGSQWFYLGVNEVLNTIVKWLDKWIILFIYPSAFAKYFNGTYEIPIFMLLLGAVGNVSTVAIAKHTIEDKAAIISIFKKPITLLAAIVFPSFMFLFFNAEEIFYLFFGSKYLESIPIFKMTIFILPARIVYSTSVLQVYNKSKIILQGVILDIILAIIFMVVLYPYLQLPGLALAFALSTYIQVFYYLWHTSNLLKTSIASLLPLLNIFIILSISFIVNFLFYYFGKPFSGTYAFYFDVFVCVTLIVFFYFKFYKPKNINE